MDLGIDGLRVMISAGANGIGRAIADAFVREGARVVVCDVDAQALEALPTELAQGAMICDVADREQVAAWFEHGERTLGGLDCLVNNAGIAGPTGGVDAIDPSDWDRCLAVNLTGQFNCARLAIPLLRRSGNASMLNLSSLAGRMGFALRAPYAASKWGVIGLTKSLARELGDDGIRVNALLPGIVAGDRQKRVLTEKASARGIPFETMEELAFSYTAIKEYVTPEQLAALAVLTASPRAPTISAHPLHVCGGTNRLG